MQILYNAKKTSFRLSYLSFRFENKKSMCLAFTDDKTGSESYERFLWLGISILNENVVF